jgi:hypothetical protein
MSEWFDHINFFLHTHPYWIPKLIFLLRVKCALLSMLMAYFVYRIYKEQPQLAKAKVQERPEGQFLA